MDDSIVPIRVVVFCSGPVLNHDVKQFLTWLEAHPEIELAAAFCQAREQSLGAVFMDLWRRRKILAVPLFFSRYVSEAARFLANPRAEATLRQNYARLTGRIHFIADIHASEVLDEVRRLRPDLGLIYGSPILKPVLFTIPKFGTLGIHHGKLPDYRGNKTAFWAMYNGETTAGVTIQKVNEGLDTGEILLEGSVTIGRKSYSRVFNELEALGLDLYLRAVLEVRNGSAVGKAQAAKKGKLYRNPKAGDFVRLWIKQMRRSLKPGQQVGNSTQDAGQGQEPQ
jgi:folate-dependent phosphoribosylglycinamide formyltransferase PurN